MRYIFLLLALSISSCSSNLQKNSDPKIEFVKKTPQNCRFVRQQTCESIRPNGKEHCFKEIEAIAREENINKILIEEVAQQHNTTNIGNNLMGTLETYVDARFYKCNELKKTLI